MKHFDLKTFENSGELVETVAEAWLDVVNQSAEQNIPHFVALPGGRIAGEFFIKAAVKSIVREISL
ncbi:MAG: hypothetical protein ABIQ35_02880, partial [Verrucomicrobiota bacterium]